MVNFSLSLDLTHFMVPNVTCSIKKFEGVMTEGRLDKNSATTIPLPDIPPPDFIALFCSRFKMAVVEQVGGAASLYGCTVRSDEICVLLKFNGSLTVNIKGNDQLLLNSFVDLVNSTKF